MSFRTLLGVYLVFHFAALVPWAAEVFSWSGVLPAGAYPLYGAPWFVTALTVFGAAFGALVTTGKHDRLAALGAWLILAFLHLRNPLIANPSLPFVGWLLLAHASLGRRTPDMWAAAWIVMSVAYTYSGWMKLSSPSWVDGTALQAVLENPLARPAAWLVAAVLPEWPLKLMTWFALSLELFFAPLALSRRLRPGLWTSMTVMHVGLLFLVDFEDLSVGMLLLHLYTFDPSWIPPLPAVRPETLYYDADCGICQRFVSRVRSFRLVPLGADAESMLVRTDDGRLLDRSAAVRHVLRRMGGWPRVLAVVPWPDFAYDFVAHHRARLSRMVGAPACGLPR